MSDLVERLRDLARRLSFYGDQRAMVRKAADEIERLTAAEIEDDALNEELMRSLLMCTDRAKIAEAELASLRGENKRLAIRFYNASYYA